MIPTVATKWSSFSCERHKMDTPTTQTVHPRQRYIRLTRTERIVFLLLGVALAMLLAIAAWLNPDPSGHGTHRQLGLPSCTMVAFFGIRCPGCGMTTSWAHTLNGDIQSGLRCNTAGVLFCLFTGASVPCFFLLAIRGKTSNRNWVSRVSVPVLILIVLISIAEWLIRLASNASV